MYTGKVSLNNNLNIECKVEPMIETIGYVKNAVISSDGKNRVFLVHRGLTSYFKNSFFHTSNDNKRIKLLEKVQKEGQKNVNERHCNWQIFTIFAKTKTFYVHEFMLKLRVPQLYKNVYFNEEIDLKKHNDQVIWEFLEFIYSNSSTSINLFIKKGRFFI